MLLKQIQTGKTLTGSRKAILVADEKVKAGELAPLVEFFASKKLAATVGYDEGHLLRVQGFKNDEELRHLLTKEFPEWVKQNSKILPVDQLLDSNPVFVPLDRSEHGRFSLKRFSHQYATPLVGAMSSVSAISMLAKDVLVFRDVKTPPVDKMKAGISGAAATFFVSASVVLTALGLKAAHKPSVTELLHSLEPQLNLDPSAFDPSAQHQSPQRQIYSTMINNPWKIATFLNFCGVVIKSVGHSIPSKQIKRNPITLKTTEHYGNDGLELASTVSSLAGLGLIASASSAESPTLLNIKSFEKSKEANDPLQSRYRPSHSILSPLDPANDQGKSGHLNMKAAGLLSMVSNAGFGMKGVLDVAAGHRMNDDIAKRARNSWPLLLILPFNIAADYFTTLAKPHFSYAIDEIAAESADYIARKLDIAKTNPETVARQTYVLSELLAQHPRVRKSAHQLREAIAARLVLDHGYKMPDEGQGLKEYQHLQQVSPFAALDTADKKPLNEVNAVQKLETAVSPIQKIR